MSKEDLLKIIQDPKEYLERFTKIKGKTPGLIPFILNNPQRDLLNTLRKNSRVILLKARQIGFCLDKDTKILCNDLTWKKIKDIPIGQKVVSVDELSNRKQGERKMTTGVVENKWDVSEEAYELIFEDGRTLIATANHRFLSKKRGHVDTAWIPVSKLSVGMDVRYVTSPWDEGSFEDAWFGGILDGEGSLRHRNHTGAEVCAVQRHGTLWEEMKKYAYERGYSALVEHDLRKKSNIPNGKFGNNPCAKIVFSRMNEIFQVIGQTRPKRFIGVEWWNGKTLPGKKSGIGWEKIKNKRSLGVREMIDLQTSTKTFIAEGFVSHNSTAIAGYFYHKTITTPGTNTALVAHKAEVAAEFLDKIKTFWRSTPESLRPQLHYNSKYEISFPALNSKIMVLSGENVGRGMTIHNVLASELAQWDKPEEMMLALENAVPTTGQIVVESTPFGVGNLFHRMWMAKDNGYVKREYGWWWMYSKEDIELIRKRIGDPMKFAQEYELEFLASGRQVFNPHLVKRMRSQVWEVGHIIKLDDGTSHMVKEREDGLRIYKPPVEGNIYVMGADVSEGVTGGDYSTCAIFDRKSGEEVAFYRGHIVADKFGTKLNEWGRLYNNALMVIEINGHGLTTVTAVRNLMYPALYFRPAKFDTMGTKWSDRLGWKTTRVTRPLMIDDLNEALNEGSVIIHSNETVDEMVTFVLDDGNNMIAMHGFHDDCIFGTAISFQGFKVLYDKPLDQLEYEDHLPASTPY